MKRLKREGSELEEKRGKVVVVGWLVGWFMKIKDQRAKSKEYIYTSAFEDTQIQYESIHL